MTRSRADLLRELRRLEAEFARLDGHARAPETRRASILADALEAQRVDLPDDFDPAENYREKGRLQARIEMLRERAIADPDLIDGLRILAWLRNDGSRVTGYADGRIECPDGWPEGVDGEAEVRRYVDETLGDGTV